MEMIERVARAIAKGCNLDPDAFSPKAAESGHEIQEWRFFVPAAQLAITEMREPTEAQTEAMRNVSGAGYPYSPNPVHPLGYLQVAVLWRAGVDAATTAEPIGIDITGEPARRHPADY